MFCAKAGAKMVVAVDNSDIIDRAREIVYDNGFGDVIKYVFYTLLLLNIKSYNNNINFKKTLDASVAKLKK